MKLTKYQIETLHKIAQGKVEGMIWDTARTVYSVHRDYNTMETVNCKTIQALRKHNLIIEGGKHGSPYTTVLSLTEEGKKAIGIV